MKQEKRKISLITPVDNKNAPASTFYKNLVERVKVLTLFSPVSFLLVSFHTSTLKTKNLESVLTTKMVCTTISS